MFNVFLNTCSCIESGNRSSFDTARDTQKFVQNEKPISRRNKKHLIIIVILNDLNIFNTTHPAVQHTMTQ